MKYLRSIRSVALLGSMLALLSVLGCGTESNPAPTDPTASVSPTGPASSSGQTTTTTTSPSPVNAPPSSNPATSSANPTTTSGGTSSTTTSVEPSTTSPEATTSETLPQPASSESPASGMETVTDVSSGPAANEMEWLPSWGTTMQRTELKNIPNNGADPKTNWPNKTVRQFIWPTFSGSEIRLRLNNERGESALDVQKLHIAMAKTAGDPGNSQGQIDTATDTELTFEGAPSVSVPAGMAVWSDPIQFPLEEIKLTAITMQLGTSVPTAVTGHPGARTTTYFGTGDLVSNEAISGATTIDRWYFIETLEVMAPNDAYTIAAFGDSITDGYGILNKFERWPDYLTLRIKEDPVLGPKRSVVNFGMGANNLTKDSTEENDANIVTQFAGTKRFDRDVLSSSKIKWVILLEGVNDMASGNVTAQPLIDAYSSLIERAHQKGILVYGSPITPCSGGLCPAERGAVNTWIETSGEFDAVVDFAAAVSTSDNVWNAMYKNDDLHPNSAGYKAMADAIDLSLFNETMN